MRFDVEFHILTMASRSNYTSAFHMNRPYFSRAEISRLRREEGELFALHLSGIYHAADLNEATLRYEDTDWDSAFFASCKVAVSAFNNRRADDSELTRWSDRFQEFLQTRKFDEIWVPLGAGNHSDHDLARNAALEVLIKRKAGQVVRVYSDVPYSTEHPEHAQRIRSALRDAGAELTPCFQDISAEFGAKLSLLTIFASQFKVPALAARIEESAREGEALREHLWTVTKLPEYIDRVRMWLAFPEIEAVRAELGRQLRTTRDPKRVAVFAITASGDWTDDIAKLECLFPNSVVRVYAAPTAAAELSRAQLSGAQVKILNGSVFDWLRAAIRELGATHRIVITGRSLLKAKALRLLWPFGHTLLASHFDHMNQAFSLLEGDAARQ